MGITQSLNEAWEVLRDPQRKEAYDVTWRQEKEKALPAHQRADLHRRRGNELYGKARELTKDGGSVMNLTAVHQSMKLYKNAMEEYTIAMESAPNDHRLYSNRALCYLAVEEWEKAKGDSLYCARLRPDFKKAWLLLTKSLWKMGCMEEANEQLQQGLRHLPGCPELLELQVDFGREIADASFRQASRSVSPAYTPTPSRQQTPTPSRHTHRPGLTVEIQDQATDLSVRGSWLLEVLPLSLGLLPLLLPRMLAHRRGRRDLLRIVVARATYPLWMPVSKREISGLLHPCSQLARCPPSHEAMAQSFPASAHTMWAGNSTSAHLILLALQMQVVLAQPLTLRAPTSAALQGMTWEHRHGCLRTESLHL